MSGGLLTWGWNQNAQLGHGDAERRIKPQFVESLHGCSLLQVECGTRYTVILNSFGQVLTCGRGDDHQLGHGRINLVGIPRLVSKLDNIKIVSVAAKGSHTLVLSREGAVYAWGRNIEGQLGLGHRDPGINPTIISKLADEGVFITEIACGRVHSAAISSKMKVYTWGSGEEGATGHHHEKAGEFVLEPKMIESLDNATHVACGSRHTLIVANRNGERVSSLQNALYTFGWGSYGQLGHGDRLSCVEPKEVLFNLESNVHVKIVQVACGYRHSMAVLESDSPLKRELWSWGWNLYGQLGYATDNTTLSMTPQKTEGLPNDIIKVCGGGRHTIAILQRATDGATRMYSWGHNDDGQLGIGNAMHNRTTPSRVISSGVDVLAIGAGWSHSAAVLDNGDANGDRMRRTSSQLFLAPQSQSSSSETSGTGYLSWSLRFRKRYMELTTYGNLDAGFAQFLNSLILLLNVLTTLRLRAGLEQRFIIGQVVPGATLTVFVSNMLFGAWADKKTTPSNVATALPHGINTVLFFAFTMLILAPVYEKTGSAYLAYRTGLACCFVLGILELLSLFIVDKIRSVIPRAAMMSAMAGVSLTFIAMTFSLQIFANPAVAIVPLVIIFVCYGSNMQLPYNIPAGMGALLIGTGIVWFAQIFDIELMDPASTPPPMDVILNAKTMYLPSTSIGSVLEGLFDSETWPYVTTVVFPMLIVNIVTNLSCIDGAATLGDDYNTRSALALDALVTVFGSLVGNPFPTCIYIGHGAFKAMGANSGFSYVSAVAVLLLGTFNAASTLMMVVPEVAAVGILMWIGIVVTSQAFDRDNQNTEESVSTKSHAAAVALGLLPALATWCLQYIQAVIPACSKVLSDNGHVYHVPFDSVMMKLEGTGVYVYGLAALSRGYLLASIFWSSTLVEIIDRNFAHAAYWMLCASVLSFIGVVHSFHFDSQGISSNYGFPARMEGEFPIKYCLSYATAALVLFFFEMKESGRSYQRTWEKFLNGLKRLTRITTRHALDRKNTFIAKGSFVGSEGGEDLPDSPPMAIASDTSPLIEPKRSTKRYDAVSKS